MEGEVSSFISKFELFSFLTEANVKSALHMCIKHKSQESTEALKALDLQNLFIIKWWSYIDGPV